MSASVNRSGRGHIGINMEIEQYIDPFSNEKAYLVKLSKGELRWLRFDMSIALAHQNNLDSFAAFLYDTDEFD